MLHTTFESTRIIGLDGEPIKLYTIEDDENLFTKNNSEFYFFHEKVMFITLNELDDIIRSLWKALNTNDEEKLTFEKFKLIFEYGKLNFNEENLKLLWSYCDQKNKNFVVYSEFVNFIFDIIHCLKAYYISIYKSENNLYVKSKIESSVEIMNQHFKEYDFEENSEISFENLKKCLSKENDIFTRKEIEIILKQINPNKNFEYWKFDKILKILYVDNFNYTQLMKEDKIYNYLIKIFSKQDIEQTGKLHYKKMEKAFIIEEKLKLNKTQILVILNFFDINTNPEIDYYKASTIIRNIIQELFDPDAAIQKLEIINDKYQRYKHYLDKYDDLAKSLKQLFINYDKYFDHLLNKEEFKEFIEMLVPYANEADKNELFNFTKKSSETKINFNEFKNGFEGLVQITRIKNVMKKISDLKVEKQDELQGEIS